MDLVVVNKFNSIFKKFMTSLITKIGSYNMYFLGVNSAETSSFLAIKIIKHLKSISFEGLLNKEIFKYFISNFS